MVVCAFVREAKSWGRDSACAVTPTTHSASIGDAGGDLGKFLLAATQHYVDLLTKWRVGKIAVHDSTAVMAVLRPELFTGAFARVDVETKGEIARGECACTLTHTYSRAHPHAHTALASARVIVWALVGLCV